MRQEKRQKRSFLSLLAKFNPSVITAILVFIFAVMVLFTLWFFLGYNTAVGNVGGTKGVFLTSAHKRGKEANNAEADREITALQNTVTVNDVRNKAANQKFADDIAAREVRQELEEKDYTLTQKEQKSKSNDVSTAERIVSFSYPLQLTPDITYRPATCKISAIKNGAYKYCLSATEDLTPMTPTKCGFECVPDLSYAEYEAAMVIYKAENRLGAFYHNHNSVGVKAWFKLFNVIGHDNAKVKFAQVFDKELGSICSAMEGRKFSHFESVKNVCRPFYQGQTLQLSSEAHRVHRLAIANSEL